MRRAVILVAWLIALSGVAAAATITIDIQAFIDGRSLLIFQGDTMQWHNLDYNAPGRWDGNRPTIFDTALNGVPQWTDYNWYPDWPGGAYGDVWSSILESTTIPSAGPPGMKGSSPSPTRRRAEFPNPPVGCCWVPACSPAWPSSAPGGHSRRPPPPLR